MNFVVAKMFSSFCVPFHFGFVCRAPAPRRTFLVPLLIGCAGHDSSTVRKRYPNHSRVHFRCYSMQTFVGGYAVSAPRIASSCDDTDRSAFSSTTMVCMATRKPFRLPLVRWHPKRLTPDWIYALCWPVSMK